MLDGIYAVSTEEESGATIFIVVIDNDAQVYHIHRANDYDLYECTGREELFDVRPYDDNEVAEMAQDLAELHWKPEIEAFELPFDEFPDENDPENELLEWFFEEFMQDN